MRPKRYSCYIIITTILMATPAHAFTECTYTIKRLFYGDAGQIYAVFNEQGAAYIAPTNLNKQAYLSMLLTAQTTRRPVIFRYNGSAACTAEHDDVIGIWTEP